MMASYNTEELKDILNKHKLWLNGDAGGRRANLSYANLRYANLSYANLRYANLRYANLSYANLRDANLSCANLIDANLSCANLRDANLSCANLRDANLRDADLRGCTGNGKEVKSLHATTWPISWTRDVLNIGCQSHNIAEWWAMCDTTIEAMDSQALKWWKVWKPIIKQLIETEA